MAHMLWPSFLVATTKSENSAYAFKSGHQISFLWWHNLMLSWCRLQVSTAINGASTFWANTQKLLLSYYSLQYYCWVWLKATTMNCIIRFFLDLVFFHFDQHKCRLHYHATKWFFIEASPLIWITWAISSLYFSSETRDRPLHKPSSQICHQFYGVQLYL